MDKKEEAVPSPPEIRKQLERLLKSGTFQKTSSQPKVLELIVNSSLENREITQNDIVSLLFPKGHADPKTAIARATTFHLRSTLAEYYVGEGKDDPVVIGVTIGRYRPTFSYNPNAAAFVKYLAGKRHVRTLQSVEDFVWAYRYFSEAVEEYPGFALAYSEKANISLMEAMFRPYHHAQPLVAEAERDARTALSLDERTWQAWSVLGIIHCSRFDWGSAELDFSNAIKIAPLEASESFYHCAYLIAVGRVHDALRLAESRWKRSADDLFAHLSYATILWVSRDRLYGISRNIAEGVSSRNHALSFAYALCAGIYYAITFESHGAFGRSARHFIERFHERFYGEAFPGFAMLCSALVAKYAWNESTRQSELDVVQREYALFNEKLREGYISPFQAALARIAVGEHSAAVSALNVACDHGDPKVMWLHLWPFLDSIKDLEEFKEVVHRMNLPEAGYQLLSKRSSL